MLKKYNISPNEVYRGNLIKLKDVQKYVEKYKESDRIKAIVTNLKACKANIKETKDGFIIKGPNILYNTSINTFKDHRIAMTFEILSLILGEELNTDTEQSIISTSFPEFYTIIREIHE